MAGIRTAGKAFPASTTLVTLNRAVAVSKVHGAAAALALIEPHSERLQGYFHFFGLKGAMLREPGRTEEARVAFDQASSWRKRRRKRRISGSISTASTISARRRIV